MAAATDQQIAPCTESAAATKAVVRGFIGAWNAGDFMRMTSFWAPDMVHYSRGQRLNVQEVGGAMAGMMQAFSDVELEIVEQVSEGDLVASLLTMSGTHTGEFLGHPPTGKRISCTLMGLVRVSNGKVIEHWGVSDGVHLLQQLGLVPDEYLAATA
jgi:C-1 hydroxylase